MARGRAWLAWFAGAAVLDGMGTWSMHYTGKLALRLPSPLLLDWRLVLLSLAVSIAGAAAALLVLGRGPVGWLRALVAGVFLGGVGISGLHFTGMAAIRQPPMDHYTSPVLIIASVLLAISISCAALPLVDVRMRVVPRYTGIVLRGLANPAMHYTAMASAVFMYSSKPLHLSHTVSIASLGVMGISVVPVMVLVVALLTTFLDRLHKQRALLDELFEQTPEAVALLTEKGRIVRVNREFTRLFGYRPEEAIGLRIDELIGPQDEQKTRKDGTQLDVSIVRAPVTLPSGHVQIYAMFRDITGSKKAEEALRAFPRRLIEAQEGEGKRIARELHDEIGQVLTGVGMMLGAKENFPPDSRSRIAEAQSILHDLTARVRNLALDLRPSMLDDLGLVPALEWLFGRVTRQTGLQIDFRHAGLEGVRVGVAAEIAAYRIVQEALTNVVRHAGTRNVTVIIALSNRTLRVEVVDRGVGFDQGRLKGDTVGLAGMRERVSILGGRLTVTTSPDGGTRVVAELPI